MYSYRISKFDPSAPPSQRREDWTSISDVGRSFAGDVLTREAYDEVESQYLNALRLVLTEEHATSLRVTDLLRASTASATRDSIAEGVIVDIEGAISVCRAQLREELSCHLATDDGFSVDVGFDYYLYITSPRPLGASLEDIADLGLHVESGVQSPYFNQ